MKILQIAFLLIVGALVIQECQREDPPFHDMKTGSQWMYNGRWPICSTREAFDSVNWVITKKGPLFTKDITRAPDCRKTRPQKVTILFPPVELDLDWEELSTENGRVMPHRVLIHMDQEERTVFTYPGGLDPLD